MSTRPGSWSNRDFHDEVPPRRRALERTATAAVICGLTFLVMFFAVGHESHDCGLECLDGDGIRPREPGHAWTAYRNSWQWQAQWTLGVLSFALAAVALFASTRTRWRRWSPWLLACALLCAAGWVLWRVLEPPLPTI